MMMDVQEALGTGRTIIVQTFEDLMVGFLFYTVGGSWSRTMHLMEPERFNLSHGDA